MRPTHRCGGGPGRGGGTRVPLTSARYGRRIEEGELTISVDEAQLEATLTMPGERVRAGLVPLHPASESSRYQFLLDHLAKALTPRGIAVLRFDRRPSEGNDDVPFAAQAGDALAALHLLRVELGVDRAPLGLWGWSQGAWAASFAAAQSPAVAFLILVASAGVSPAAQMRYGTGEQLRRAGYGDEALTELAELRSVCEEALRGTRDRRSAQTVIDRYADRPWFPLAHVPPTLARPARWTDMDFEPEPVFAQVRCPVLLFYGETDEWVPIEASIAAWRRASAAADNDDVEIVRLADATHAPTVDGRLEPDAVSPEYEQAMLGWLDKVVTRIKRNLGETAAS